MSPVNDGPYTVQEKLQDGLVYKVQHDSKGYTHNVSVTRMIPVPNMVIPGEAVDLPLSGAWEQLRNREDRINDKKEKPQQRELLEANSEAERKEQDEDERKVEEEEQSLRGRRTDSRIRRRKTQ